MRLLNVCYVVCAGWLGSLLAAVGWLGVWFAWKCGAHHTAGTGRSVWVGRSTGRSTP